MKKIEITTAQKVSIQYELASVANRFSAFAVDLVIWVGILIFLNFIRMAIFYDSESNLYFTYFIQIPAILFYTFFSETLLDGQTLGKKLVGLKVVKINGDPASAFDFLIRWSFRFIDIWMSAGSVAALLISSSDYNQRLGCMMSGTTVIRKISSKSFKLDDILNIKSLENYEAKYPEVIKLSEQDMLFVKKVLEQATKFRNKAHENAIDQLTEKIAELLDIKIIPGNKVEFLKNILSDYVVLTR